MKNRAVGFFIIGISALVGFVIFLFNRALTNIVNTTCSHGSSCPMWHTIKFQTNISIGIMTFILVIGAYLVFSEELARLSTKLFPLKEIKSKEIIKTSYKKILKTLNSDQKLVFEKIIKEQGAIFQSKLVETTGFNKVKVTRVLDKLEGKNLIERKRRGMSNVVILKY